MHGLKEGHIAPYTDIEFQLTKYQTDYNEISRHIITTEIWRNYYKTIDKDKTCKIDGNKNTKISFPENAFVYVVHKMVRPFFSGLK